MRTFRPVRLLVIPTVALPLVLSAVILPGSAWAKGSKTVTCRTVTGTVSAWTLVGCSQSQITGGGSTGASSPFSPGTTGATISWMPAGLQGVSTDTSTVAVTVFPAVKNKCASTGATEYEMLGRVVSNNFTPGLTVNSKVKIFVCATMSGTLSNLVKGRPLVAKL